MSIFPPFRRADPYAPPTADARTKRMRRVESKPVVDDRRVTPTGYVEVLR